MRLRKINQLTSNRVDSKKGELYTNFQKQFDYFFNADIGYKNINEINQYYIPDEETKDSLQSILADPMDSVSVLVGYQGIGKSTDIRYSYQIINSAIRFDKKNKTIIFPSFFNGYVLGHLSDDKLDTIKELKTDISKRIASVCVAIEEEFLELPDEFYSERGQKDFYDFLKGTNPKALVNNGCECRENMVDRLANAEQGDYYIYIVTKLKYYLTSELCPYNRILIILDDVESLPYCYQEHLISQYLRFYTCIRNLPNLEFAKQVYINLLISVRPTTFKLLQKAQTLSAYSITREIYKTKSVDLSEYFSKKYFFLKEEMRKDEWEDSYNVLISLSDKFEKKYSKMIKNLVFLDIRKTLKVYSQILSNNLWITKDNPEEYIFNNITVIRALACGDNTIYTNGEESLIPNILYRTIDKNDSILSLYIIAYFIRQRAGFWEYGETTVTKVALTNDFCDVFGSDNQIELEIADIIDYFYHYGLLSISIYNEEDADNITDSTLLYLSSKGLELWNMLSADSVLMELYREDYYQDYDNKKEFDFSSSHDLMNMNRQIIIFEKVYEILRELYTVERNLIYRCINDGSYNKYISIFGDILMVEHLMKGVDKSIEYSGNGNNEQILIISNELKSEIKKIKEVYMNEC